MKVKHRLSLTAAKTTRQKSVSSSTPAEKFKARCYSRKYRALMSESDSQWYAKRQRFLATGVLSSAQPKVSQPVAQDVIPAEIVTTMVSISRGASKEHLAKARQKMKENSHHRSAAHHAKAAHHLASRVKKHSAKLHKSYGELLKTDIEAFEKTHKAHALPAKKVKGKAAKRAASLREKVAVAKHVHKIARGLAKAHLPGTAEHKFFTNEAKKAKREHESNKKKLKDHKVKNPKKGKK